MHLCRIGGTSFFRDLAAHNSRCPKQSGPPTNQCPVWPWRNLTKRSAVKSCQQPTSYMAAWNPLLAPPNPTKPNPHNPTTWSPQLTMTIISFDIFLVSDCTNLQSFNCWVRLPLAGELPISRRPLDVVFHLPFRHLPPHILYHLPPLFCIFCSGENLLKNQLPSDYD